MSFPFDPKRARSYEFEFGAGGNRLGCKLRFEDGSLLFVLDSQITPEIEQVISSLGTPTAGARSSFANTRIFREPGLMRSILAPFGDRLKFVGAPNGI